MVKRISIQSGVVLDREIKANKDGDKSVILMKTEMTDPADLQTVEMMNHTGEDNNPPGGSRLTILEIGQAFKLAIASDDNIEPITAPGEKRIYSTDEDNTVVMASIWLKNDGTIVMENDNARVTIAPNGQINAFSDGQLIRVENTAGYYELLASGTVRANGATIPTNGDVRTASGISLDNHTHQQGNDSDGDTQQDTAVPQ